MEDILSLRKTFLKHRTRPRITGCRRDALLENLQVFSYSINTPPFMAPVNLFVFTKPRFWSLSWAWLIQPTQLHYLFLGASSVMSACPSAWNNSPTVRIFMKF